MPESETPAFSSYCFAECLRYKAKGWGLPVGVLLYAFAYYYAVPMLISSLLGAAERLQVPSAVALTGIVMLLHHANYGGHSIALRIAASHHWGEQYRCNPKSAWPWEDQQLLRRTYRTLLFNFFVLLPLITFFSFSSGQFQFSTEAETPFWQDQFSQFIFCMCAEEKRISIAVSIILSDPIPASKTTALVWSFTIHRINHLPLPYKLIHKQHHEYTTSIGIAGEYAHPVEQILGNSVFRTQVSVTIGPALLGNRMHLVTFLTWICYRSGNTIDQHGGYELPWSPYSILPFASTFHAATAEFHDFHHSRNVGNYGSQFTVMDWLLGTSPFYYQHMLKKYQTQPKQK